MLILEIIAEVIFLTAFFYGAVKLWKKGKPLYFQIIICAVGCFALFHLSVIVMSFCGTNETRFNDSFFGVFGGYMLLFCANRGALEKVVCEKTKKGVLVLSIAAATAAFALATFVGVFYYGGFSFILLIYLLVQLPAGFVVYYNVKHLLSPVDELGLLNGLRLTDICSLVFIITFIIDIACHKNISTVSGITDLIVSLSVAALSVEAVKGAEKWSF